MAGRRPRQRCAARVHGTRLVEEWLRAQPDPVAAERRVLEVQPLRRMAEPEAIANLVAFVASDEASAITGASLAADCGLSVMFGP
jgi:NAD(P)-dependent dehydrogenase (short-subunit alcohol dehydrogenase family)